MLDPTEVRPLDRFPEDLRAAIMAEVLQPDPPDRWRRVGAAQMANRGWWEWHWQRGLHPERHWDLRRQSIPKRIRKAVYERDGHKCLACGSTERLSLDHVQHWSMGGKDTVDNLRTLCQPCNSSRRDKTDEEWGRI